MAERIHNSGAVQTGTIEIGYDGVSPLIAEMNDTPDHLMVGYDENLCPMCETRPTGSGTGIAKLGDVGLFVYFDTCTEFTERFLKTEGSAKVAEVERLITLSASGSSVMRMAFHAEALQG